MKLIFEVRLGTGFKVLILKYRRNNVHDFMFKNLTGNLSNTWNRN